MRNYWIVTWMARKLTEFKFVELTPRGAAIFDVPDGGPPLSDGSISRTTIVVTSDDNVLLLRQASNTKEVLRIARMLVKHLQATALWEAA